jgi:hypothetical protein
MVHVRAQPSLRPESPIVLILGALKSFNTFDILGMLWLGIFCLNVAPIASAAVNQNRAEALRSYYDSFREQLNHNQFQRPIVLEATELPNSLRGDVYAVVTHSFATVQSAFSVPANWCDVLILHPNNKYCHASTRPNSADLITFIGGTHDRPLANAFRVVFTYRISARTADYFQVELNAENGPLHTSNYQIMLEGVRLADGQSFIHLAYSYSSDAIGRLAMKTYLATVGRGKVGFSIVGKDRGDQAIFISGVRGMVERNTMRYYLAIDAYLSASPGRSDEQLEKRLNTWFTATEKYPRQLNDIDRASYLRMKRNEYLRQQIVQ